MEENHQETSENEEEQKPNQQSSIIKMLLLTKKIKPGKKEKLTEIDCKIDAIVNAVQLVKALMESNTIEGVVNNENEE